MKSRLFAAVLVSASAGVGQCEPVFADGLPRAGVDGEVLASTWWDPDGGGPLAPRLVVGGYFESAGAVVANRIAAFDFATSQWTSFGDGVTATWGGGKLPHVAALTTTASGELVAGGFFTHAGGAPAASIARWDGTTWQPLGSGITGRDFQVTSLARLANGDIVAGGAFAFAGGTAAACIARWDGSQWHTLGSGVGGIAVPIVHALHVRANGELVVGGSFATAGGLAANDVARWQNGVWSTLGTLAFARDVRTFAELANGTLLAGGHAVSWQDGVACWDGSTWTQFGTGVIAGGDRVRALTVLPGGTVLAMLQFSVVMSCTGAASQWNAAFPLLQAAVCESLANGDLVLSGVVNPYMNPYPVDHIARWDGVRFRPLAAGVDASVDAAVEVPGGYVVGGWFRSIGGIAAEHVARWDGTAWHPLGGGCNGRVARLARLPDGTVVAAGNFTSAGGVAITGLAVWDGAAWAALGTGGPAGAVDWVLMPNGDLVVATDRLWRWNGSTWTTLGGVSGLSFLSLHVLPNGHVVVGGFFNWCGVPANNIARWDGAAWHAFGSGLGGGPYTLASTPNGDVYASGYFFQAGGQPVSRVARWDGTAWHAMGLGFDTEAIAMLGLPDGDVLAARPRLAGGVATNSLARWNGSAWFPVGEGVGAQGYATRLVPLANGNVLVTGEFGRAGPLAAGGLVELTPGCSLGAAPLATKCIGPGGPLFATAAADPQVGLTFVSQVSGCTTNSIAMAVFGFQPALLHWWNLPLALPGCSVLATPDVLVPSLPVAGVAAHALAVPSTPSLAGVVLWHQFAHLALNGVGSVSSIAVSNGFVLTIAP
jgi:trimeric autotransporter adhesin